MNNHPLLNMETNNPLEQDILILLKNYPQEPPTSLIEAINISRNLFEAGSKLPLENKFRNTAMFFAQEALFYVIAHASDSSFAALYPKLLAVVETHNRSSVQN